MLEGCKVKLSLHDKDGWLSSLNGQTGVIIKVCDSDEYIVQLKDETRVTLFASELNKVA